MAISLSLDGWDIEKFDDVEWSPWGSQGNARAKMLGAGDGYYVALVEAEAGYRGDPHVHAQAEFSYVIEGEVRNQGVPMKAGDGYVAAAGSRHDDFEALTDAKYIVIFTL